SELVSALTHLETTRKHLKVLRDSCGTVEGLKLTEAEAAVEAAELRLIAARQALTSLGNSASETEWSGLSADDAVRRLFGTPQREAGSPGSANLLGITSPLDGIVIASDAAKGDRADPARPLFTVADARSLWLTLAVKLEDALRLARGQSVPFRPVGATPFTATLEWISTTADEKTRTVAARAILPNADGRLAAHTFGAARVVLREEPAAVVVPSSAVHWDGNCTVVFVRDRDFEKPGAPKLFHIRSVRPGAVVGDTTEIIAGVLPGEMVAAAGSGAL